MPGMALYKEPSIYASEQANLEKWIKFSGRKVQNWHYSCYPEDRTSAVFQYPRLLQRYYRQNRDKVVGCFVNGTTDHWPRQNITLYCWMKLLWNPDFDVDAAIDEFCRRMFGPAARTMRELVEIQINGWENSRWPVPELSAKAVFAVSYPRETVLRMDQLLQRARAEAKGHDMSWSTDKVRAAVHLGKDFWSMEVYMPYETVTEAYKPVGGRMPVWYGNFTRHRVADRGLKPSSRTDEGSQREYQRMNTTYQVPSNNLQDFAPIKFVE